jgi:hypothetical protein
MTWLEGTEDTHLLFQPGHLQPSQGCVLGLLNPLKLHLEEVTLELLVSVIMLEFVVHVDIAVKAPVPIFADCLVQSGVSHQGPLEKLQEPVGHGHDHIVVITVVVGCRVDLLNPKDFVWPMLLRKPHNAAVRELLDPVSRLPHPVLDRDGKARASSVAIEHIPFWAFFSRERSAVVDKARSEEFELLSLGVALSGPLLAILLMLAFVLFESMDETPGDIGDGIEVVSDLDGSGGCAG